GDEDAESAAPKKKKVKKAEADAAAEKAEDAAEEKAEDAAEEKAEAKESVEIGGDDDDDEDETADASALNEPGKEAGEIAKITVKGVEYSFCWCPAGTFQMGAPEDELGFGANETQHDVKISKGFWMLQTEVTQKMYTSIIGKNPSYFGVKGFGKEKGSVRDREETDNFPVDRVSYMEAKEFLAKLSKICSVTFALPTEAQWEYACRAGTTSPFYTNTAPNQQQALYKIGDNAPESTDEVGKHGSNPWKLCDMMGNVDEWCRDWYDAEYYKSSPASDPTGPDSSPENERVLRGGSFANMQYYLRSATRNKLPEGAKGTRFDGFRFIFVPGGEAAPGAGAAEAGDDAEKAESNDAEAADADDGETPDAEASEESDDEKSDEETEEE
nr:formylglycine-generating enzyme family protein [Thermoguttaceae bacterium]